MPNAPLLGGAFSARIAGVFLRRKTKQHRGVGYSYWHLCETVRTARGPRQRVVASLGKLDEEEAGALRDGWDDLPALLRGETPAARTTTSPLPGVPRMSRARRGGNRWTCGECAWNARVTSAKATWASRSGTG